MQEIKIDTLSIPEVEKEHIARSCLEFVQRILAQGDVQGNVIPVQRQKGKRYGT